MHTVLIYILIFFVSASKEFGLKYGDWSFDQPTCQRWSGNTKQNCFSQYFLGSSSMYHSADDVYADEFVEVDKDLPSSGFTADPSSLAVLGGVTLATTTMCHNHNHGTATTTMCPRGEGKKKDMHVLRGVSFLDSSCVSKAFEGGTFLHPARRKSTVFQFVELSNEIMDCFSFHSNVCSLDLYVQGSVCTRGKKFQPDFGMIDADLCFLNKYTFQPEVILLETLETERLWAIACSINSLQNYECKLAQSHENKIFQYFPFVPRIVTQFFDSIFPPPCLGNCFDNFDYYVVILFFLWNQSFFGFVQLS